MAKKILVADDETHIVRIVRDALASRGYEVFTASHGAEALQLAKDECPALVILDVMMPQMDGFEVCRAIRADAALSGVPVFLLTARGQESDFERGREVGADQYLTKPFSPRRLADLVDETLGGA